MLKEDKLEVFEIYLNLKRELKEFVERGHCRTNMAANVSLVLTFEKWAGSLLFDQVTSSLRDRLAQVPILLI